MSAALADGLPSFGRENESDSFLKFRHVKALFLKIGVFANKPSGIKLGSASSVGIATPNFRTLL